MKMIVCSVSVCVCVTTQLDYATQAMNEEYMSKECVYLRNHVDNIVCVQYSKKKI